MRAYLYANRFPVLKKKKLPPRITQGELYLDGYQVM